MVLAKCGRSGFQGLVQTLHESGQLAGHASCPDGLQRVVLLRAHDFVYVVCFRTVQSMLILWFIFGGRSTAT